MRLILDVYLVGVAVFGFWAYPEMKRISEALPGESTRDAIGATVIGAVLWPIVLPLMLWKGRDDV